MSFKIDKRILNKIKNFQELSVLRRKKKKKTSNII
ncbi:unnamed protein product [Arabidopsis halleri]